MIKLTATMIVLEQSYEYGFLPEKEYERALFVLRSAARFEQLAKVAIEMKHLAADDLKELTLRFCFIEEELDKVMVEHSKQVKELIGENLRLKKVNRELIATVEKEKQDD